MRYEMKTATNAQPGGCRDPDPQNKKGRAALPNTLTMPVKAIPYRHQYEAFNFACGLFGLLEGGDAQHSIRSRGMALLMEM